VTAIAAGYGHALALKDGGVIAWGADEAGQSTVPEAATSGVTAIAAGVGVSLALKDGKVIFWGDEFTGRWRLPADAGSGVTAISVGGSHALAIRNTSTVPSAPVNVKGVALDRRVKVSWSMPADSASATRFTVTSSPGNKKCTTRTSMSCVIRPLRNGKAYTFTVTASNAEGTSRPSIPSAPVTPQKKKR
jgi:hypothetical protein